MSSRKSRDEVKRGEGNFSTHEHVQNIVIKRLALPLAPMYHVLGIVAPGHDMTSSYIEAMQSIGVRLPAIFGTRSTRPELVVHQAWVNGPTLAGYAEAEPLAFIDCVAEIRSWIESSASYDARIDANLENFVVASGAPVLIDLLPPLIPSLAVEPGSDDLFGAVFHRLCFSIDSSILALVSYACRVLLKYHPSQWSTLSSRLLLELPNEHPTTVAQAWFVIRVRAIQQATDGKIGVKAMEEVFKITSITKLLQEAKQEQWDAVSARASRIALYAKEFGLELPPIRAPNHAQVREGCAVCTRPRAAENHRRMSERGTDGSSGYDT